MKKVGLALSGGGASGLAHIGVLKVLEDNDIKVDVVSGVSFGALIGGLYSAGYSAYEIENIAKNIDWGRLLDFTLPVNSFIRGRRFENTIRKLIGNKSFKELDKKFSVVAANLDKGGEVVFEEGDVASAIRASIAIPGLIAAKRIGKNRYVDGSLVDPTGIMPLKRKCRILIAVSLCAPFEKNIKMIKSGKGESEFKSLVSNNVVGNSVRLFKRAVKENQFQRVPKIFLKTVETILDRLLTPSRLMNLLSGGISPGMVETVLRSYQISMNRLHNLNLEIGKPDVVITPEHKYLGWVEFDKIDEFILAGEKAARKEIKKIKRLL
ncbi:MAG: patatin-like phospholipase family protein [Candidatus Woesearchaeota archaeon]